MKYPHVSSVAMLSLLLGACGAVETSTGEQAELNQQGVNLQGVNLQGVNLQGVNLQGVNLQGFRLGGAMMSTDTLDNVRIEHGEIVAERRGVTLHGTDLVNAQFEAQAQDANANPVVIGYQITAVTAETNTAYDPTSTGQTFLYMIEQWIPGENVWRAACPADGDGAHVAIPLDAWWDEHGDRHDSSSGSLFTFACTSGVIAKCYRWGYRPWVTGYGDLTAMHWACTRLARADYCGDGVPHTQNGTWVNVWDTLSTQIQHPATSTGMVFEAGWTTAGAVCVNHTRWPLSGGQTIATMCPNFTMPSCGTASAVLDIDSTTKLFNESYLTP